MARKPKAQLHPDVAAALPVALAAMDDAPSPEPPERVGNEAPGHAEKSQTESDASTDPVPMDTGPAVPGDDAQPPLPGLGALSSAQPAAYWDRTTDRVQFDWPAIERTAAQEGPNQGMAKLLVAACAEGARSRWPF